MSFLSVLAMQLERLKCIRVIFTVLMVSRFGYGLEL